uniref:NB-ARC domain-containing protein n=1 Tax=Amycolatopsis sp. CA-096443 TaxID=3239919 RepID=UPI003F49766A
MTTDRFRAGDGFIPGLTPLVGREEALKDLIRKLEDGERLIELLGYGGVGKTRLAQELHRDLLRRRVYQDAVFVSLARAKDSGGDADEIAKRILQDIAAALMDNHQPGAQTFDSLIALLTGHLRKRRVLLVLDNCEPVAGGVAAVVETLLEAEDAAGLQVVVTSRENLGIWGECCVSVRPLPCPAENDAPCAAAQTGAMTLFLDRATRAAGRPVTESNAWPDLVQLVRYSQGSPLILQLLASELSRGGAAELLAKIKTKGISWLSFPDRARISEHHRRLDIAMGGSWDSCTREERLLWSRLAVFSGGFGLESAQEVCSDEDLPRDRIEQLLGDLVQRSVVEPGTAAGRYDLHTALHEYGLRMLGDALSTFQDRHCDWISSLALTGASGWFGPDEKPWLDRFDIEASNVGRAVDWCAERGEAERGLAIVTNVHRVRTPYHHARERTTARWFDSLFAIGNAEPTLPRVAALSSAAFMRTVLGDVRGQEHLREIRHIGQTLPAVAGFAPAQLAEGTYRALVELDPAGMDLLKNAVGGFRAMGPDFAGDEQMGKLMLGMSAGLIGPAWLADETARDCLEHAEKAGAAWAVTWARWLLMLPMRTHREDVGGEVITAQLNLGDAWGPPWTLEAELWALAQRDPERAARLAGASSAWQERHGVAMLVLRSFDQHRKRAVAVIKSKIGAEKYLRLEREGRCLAVTEIHKLMLKSSPPPLDALQMRVVSLVAAGWRNRDIAIELETSDSSVGRVLTSVYDTLKLDGDRTKLAGWFRRYGAAG